MQPPHVSPSQATSEKGTEIREPKARLSTLWVVVMFNMLFADVLTLYIPESLQEVLSGSTSMESTPALMLVMAVIIEIPIAMIFLSRVLQHRANRWANTVAGVITITFIVVGGSPAPHYAFFAAAQGVCVLAIIWQVWKGHGLEEYPSSSKS